MARRIRTHPGAKSRCFRGTPTVSALRISRGAFSGSELGIHRGASPRATSRLLRGILLFGVALGVGLGSTRSARADTSHPPSPVGPIRPWAGPFLAPPHQGLSDAPPDTAKREWAPGPLEWTPGESRRFACAPHHTWILTVEEATTGTAVTERTRTPIRQTRIRIALDTGGRPRDLAFLQHVGDTEVQLLAPGDPRLNAVINPVDSRDYPWPNMARLSFRDLPFPLDLDQNGRPELAINRWASISDPAAFGILLLEADAAGSPHLLALSDLAKTIRFTDADIVDIEMPAGAFDPILHVVYQPLYRCRFLAQIGIRGEPNCETCCMFPILLRRAESGYVPTYDRLTQQALLDRCTGEIGAIRDADPSLPPTTGDEVAIANVAAFFYLTGTGRNTRSEMIRMLGDRSRNARVLILLDRIEKYFLPAVTPS